MTSSDHALLILEQWFRGVVGAGLRAFGSRTARYQGFSDGVEGVQWNAGIDRARSVATVGVNLEGMKDQGWPIARVLLHERREPAFPSVLRSLAPTHDVEVWLERDAWQAAARPPILESFIGPSGPVPGSSLTDALWHEMVGEALGCLDESRGYAGRGRQVVTLPKAGRQEKDVSPHLQVKVAMPIVSVSEQRLADAHLLLRPVHLHLARMSKG